MLKLHHFHICVDHLNPIQFVDALWLISNILLFDRKDHHEQLDLEQLESIVQFYFRSSLAPSTQYLYDSAKCRYRLFCNNANMHFVPVTEDKLCNFAAYLRFLD